MRAGRTKEDYETILRRVLREVERADVNPAYKRDALIGKLLDLLGPAPPKKKRPRRKPVPSHVTSPPREPQVGDRYYYTRDQQYKTLFYTYDVHRGTILRALTSDSMQEPYLRKLRAEIAKGVVQLLTPLDVMETVLDGEKPGEEMAQIPMDPPEEKSISSAYGLRVGDRVSEVRAPYQYGVIEMFKESPLQALVAWDHPALGVNWMGLSDIVAIKSRKKTTHVVQGYDGTYVTESGWDDPEME